MTFTYTNHPASRTLDALRLLLRDTSSGAALFQDEELTYFIGASPNTYFAASMAADVAAARYTALGQKSVGDLSISYPAAAQDWQAMSKKWASLGALSAVPFSGGISVAGKASEESDSDRDAPSFKRGQFDFQ